MTTNTPQTNQYDPVLRWPEVHKITGIARNTAHTLARSNPPKFPKPIKLGERSSGWLLSEINAWLQGRIAERDAKGGTKNASK